MRKRITGKKVENSSSFRTAKDAASEYANNPKKLNALLDRAVKKADSSKERLAETWESLLASFRLLRAYATGQYRDIPWASLLSIVAAVIYFVMPLDLIPDFILALGLIDDAALLGWILSSLKGNIDHYLEWEQKQAPFEENGPDRTDSKIPPRR
ncbi:MAG: DUF1232 domain-containing protein [Gammaproteobacteria bacterium]|nr:DUF1232 domain-containing protein [Gammaproteobacteria bacterium]